MTSAVGIEDLRELPAVLRVWSPDPQEPTLAVVLGLSKAAAWAAVHAGQLPARRVGHRWLVPTPELLRWLGAAPDAGSGQVPSLGRPTWHRPPATECVKAVRLVPAIGLEDDARDCLSTGSLPDRALICPDRGTLVSLVSRDEEEGRRAQPPSQADAADRAT